MEWNPETVLDALNEFERKPELTQPLNDYITRIAKNGEIVFPWSKLKPVLKKKLDVVLDTFYESCPVETAVPIPNFETFNYDTLKKTILQAVDSFTSAPFTIQRLCELVMAPQDHYNRPDKYMRGIEKNVLVVSTVEPRSAQGDGNSPNPNPIVNGIVSDTPRDDNDTLNGHENTDTVSSSNLNTPSNHVLLENFANVFPSAACIPSASNICIEREIDNNFMENSEETRELEFEATPVVTTSETTATPKDEDMDTTEDDQANVSSDSSEITSADSESPDHSDTSESEKAPESTSDPAPASVPEATTEETITKEADVLETKADSPPPDSDMNQSDDCQQDDTVSQSDFAGLPETPMPPTNIELPVELETTEDLVPSPEKTPEDLVSPPEKTLEVLSPSVVETEPADQKMELESSTDSEDPSV